MKVKIVKKSKEPLPVFREVISRQIFVTGRLNTAGAELKSGEETNIEKD